MVCLGQQTEKIYLSGKDYKHPVAWEFFCTDGQNSNKWTTINVPSNWELEGFGTYTYGRWYKELQQDQPSKEEGFYRHKFKVPKVYNNQQVRIVFGGVMTDAQVKVNGQLAGAVHQGGFYEFSYDISDLVESNFDNLLEVHVKKHSDNSSVNNAERRADWWLFGGIYRPVWLEIKPKSHVEHLAIDAQMDGTINISLEAHDIPHNTTVVAEIFPVTAQKKDFSPQMSNLKNSKETLSFKWMGIDLWTPEHPNLYLLKLQLKHDGKVLHEVKERFGFRTLEFKEKDGIYLNGKKVVFKGINRHSFWPESGRSTDKEISIMDVNLIKDMNMNAVRMHYPPDDHFLEVCDSLGLFVLDELAGWHGHYDKKTGAKLIKEMVDRDVNHPSVTIWDQGNEGGWIDELDTVFYQRDPQQRLVIHPWADYKGWDTHHYPTYLTGVHRFVNGENVFFPTEFMHGTYDNGHGAGLEDFWKRYSESPLFAGGFLWAFSDGAVLRSDWNGPKKYDSKGSLAADGILGPHREKEGSFYTVKALWSPVQFEPLRITKSFTGEFYISNQYLFTNLNKTTMLYRVVELPNTMLYQRQNAHTIAEGIINLPSILPGEKRRVHLDLPGNFFKGDWLEITAKDPYGREINTWTWPIHRPSYYSQKLIKPAEQKATANIVENAQTVALNASNIKIEIGKKDGLLKNVSNQLGRIPLDNGPIPIGFKATVEKVKVFMEEDTAVCVVEYNGGIDHIKWKMYPDGRLKMHMVALKNVGRSSGFDGAFFQPDIDVFGITFSYPEQGVKGMRWFGSGPYRVWKNRIKGANFGFWEKQYNNTITGESFENLIYPEFKGYHANLMAASIEADKNSFKVFSESEKVFLRLFTPEQPKNGFKGSKGYPDFPEGDLSFLYEIPAMHSFKPVPQHGPNSQPTNIRIKSGDDGISMILWLDFRN